MAEAAASVRVDLLRGDAAREAVPALAAVLVDCVAGGASVSFMAPFTQADGEAFFRDVAESVSRGERLLFAAAADGRIAGTVQVILALPPNQPHRGEIAKLLVHRQARGRGFARALMLAAEAEAKARGRSLLSLDTASAEADRLYRSLGYIETGVIPDYALLPDGGFCDTTIFWKRL